MDRLQLVVLQVIQVGDTLNFVIMWVCQDESGQNCYKWTGPESSAFLDFAEDHYFSVVVCIFAHYPSLTFTNLWWLIVIGAWVRPNNKQTSFHQEGGPWLLLIFHWTPFHVVPFQCPVIILPSAESLCIWIYQGLSEMMHIDVTLTGNIDSVCWLEFQARTWHTHS